MRRLPVIAAAALLAALAGWCGCVQTISRSRTVLPYEHTVVRDQLVIHSNFPVASRHRLLDELAARRRDLSALLDLPHDGEPIDVYLFDDGQQFGAFIAHHFPEFPARRAYFVQTDTRLEVYAYWGDRVAEDLRHEVTHGYIHSVVPNIPLWLDEGLAEYFEVPRGQGGINRAHQENLLDRLGRDEWQPNLERLARLDGPFDMTLDDYAECWAWIHFLLESEPRHRDILRRHLAELRWEESPRPFRWLLRHELGQPEACVIEHVRSLGRPARTPGK